MKTIGVKELKNKLSSYLKGVKLGEKILITERKKAIASIVPIERGEEGSSLLALVKEGFASWKGGKPRGISPPLKLGGKAVSKIVREDRR